MNQLDRIDALLSKQGRNKMWLAQAVGTNHNTVYGWFFRKSILPKWLDKVATALNTTTEYLNGETGMNANKLERALQGQSTLAQRIYNCVPKNQSWSSSQIASHYGRDFPPARINVIDGCLYSLKEAGVVKEVMKGHWIKTPISNVTTTEDVESQFEKMMKEVETKADTETTTTEKAPMLTLAKKPEPTVAKKSDDPLSLIGDITSRMKGLIEELEDAAVAVTEMISESDKKSEQLAQLKALLKNIAD